MAGFENPLDRWNERFSAEGYLFGDAPNAWLAGQAARLRPGNALSIADGEGRNSVWLAQQGLQVEAFDFSPVAVAKARQLAASRGVAVDFHCAPWQDFGWGQDRFDNVVGIFFQFADPGERTELFARMDQALRPGSMLFILGYGRDQLRYNTGGPGKLAHLYDEDLLRKAFPGHDVLESRHFVDVIHEGSGHSGPSDLVGFVSRKPG
jgi:SAM-dependent methyltransferase